MTGDRRPPGDRMLLFAAAACCAGPTLAVVVLTSVLGLAIGPAGPLTVGLLAAFACVALMLRRHHRPTRTGD